MPSVYTGRGAHWSSKRCGPESPSQVLEKHYFAEILNEYDYEQQQVLLGMVPTVDLRVRRTCLVF